MSDDVKRLFSMDLAGDPTGDVAAKEGGGCHRVLRAAAGPPRRDEHPAAGETGAALDCRADTGLCCRTPAGRRAASSGTGTSTGSALTVPTSGDLLQLKP